jgi:hypothetical protein
MLAPMTIAWCRFDSLAGSPMTTHVPSCITG